MVHSSLLKSILILSFLLNISGEDEIYPAEDVSEEDEVYSAEDIDINNDKIVTRRELYNWFRDLVYKEDLEDVYEDFSQADTDEDDKISLEEALRYNQVIFSMNGNENDIQKFRILHNSSVFVACDKSRDGFLNLEEFGVFLYSDDETEIHPKVIEVALKEYDHNGNEEIDWCEIHDCTNDGPKAMPNYYFMDQSHGDFKLNKTEILTWVYFSEEFNSHVDDLMSNAFEVAGVEEKKDMNIPIDVINKNIDAFTNTRLYAGEDTDEEDEEDDEDSEDEEDEIDDDDISNFEDIKTKTGNINIFSDEENIPDGTLRDPGLLRVKAIWDAEQKAAEEAASKDGKSNTDKKTTAQEEFETIKHTTGQEDSSRTDKETEYKPQTDDNREEL